MIRFYRPLRPYFRPALMLLMLVAVATAATGALACPTCKEGLAENDPSAQSMARGYFFSILFMMSMPFVIIGTFGGAAYLSIRRARDRQEELPGQDAESRIP